MVGFLGKENQQSTNQTQALEHVYYNSWKEKRNDMEKILFIEKRLFKTGS